MRTVSHSHDSVARGPVRQAAIGVCGTCMDARGIRDADLVPGSHRGTLEEMADWILWADKVIVF